MSLAPRSDGTAPAEDAGGVFRRKGAGDPDGPVHDGLESMVLARLIRNKILGGASEHSASPMAAAGHIPSTEFVRFRFRSPWEDGRSKARWFGVWATLLNIVGVTAGLASSSLATVEGAQDGFTGQSIAIALLGLLVSVTAATNQITRFGERSIAQRQMVNALRREGWDFINDRGHYRDQAGVHQWQTFVDEVGRIQKAVEVVDEADTERTH